jgi:hypothetical protein
MAAFWLERRRRQEQADRAAHARSRRLLLPLEETSPGVGPHADTDSAGTTLPADDPRFGDVSSSGVSVATTDEQVIDARSTVAKDRAA